ncbi:hypothetical protein [Flavobacterium piscinae]|uniref:hypothetical protein n=1 Tax=Flavobacterium piscinae TaxID=2506424 RepID=UPI002AABAF7E|nr:hypothetical protein [Flavobacterium piscinae]
MKDVYGAVPFKVKIDKTKPQLLRTLIGINFISENTFELRVFLMKNKLRFLHIIQIPHQKKELIAEHSPNDIISIKTLIYLF